MLPFVSGSASSGSLALPAFNNVSANWQNAGLQPIGGIPNRNTQCGATVTPTGLPPPQANDDAVKIQNAINACTSGQFVLLNGAFQMTMAEMPISVKSSITLRGSGTCNNVSSPYCPTSITVIDGSLDWVGGFFGIDVMHEIGCFNTPTINFQPSAAANQFDFGWKGQLGSCGVLGQAIGCGTQIDADAAQGATTVQVHDTTGFSAGGWVMIDEASGSHYVNDPIGPNLYGQVWAADDWLSSSGSPATGRVQWSKFSAGGGDMGSGAYPYNNPGTIQSMYDRATTEIHLISAVGAGPCPGTGCTVTFDSPLMVAMRRSGVSSFTGAIAGTTLTTTGDPCTLSVAQIVADASATGAAVADGSYVTAVNSCSGGVGNYTLTISQTVTSRAMIGGAHQGHVYYPTTQSGFSMPFLAQAGIENMTVARASGGGINFQYCAYCWVKGVEVVSWQAGAVNHSWVARNQVQSSYMNHCANSVNNGAEYPIGIQDAATESYIVDTIIRMCGKGLVGKGASGAVVAYNYSDATMYDSFSGIGDYWLDMNLNGSHWAGTHHFLFEGNWANNCDNDDTHGNQVYHTYFRNQCTGVRSPFTDPSIPAAVNDATGTGQSCGTSGPSGCSPNAPTFLRVNGPMTHNYWDAYISNVFGLSGTTTTGNGWQYGNCTYANNKCIWAAGWNSDASHTTASDPNLTGATGTFLFKNCNYDYVNASIPDCATGFAHSFANSLYLPSGGTSAPSFFSAGATCTYAYPWVTPASSPQIQVPSGGGSCSTYSGLPAKARFDAGTPFVQP